MKCEPVGRPLSSLTGLVGKRGLGPEASGEAWESPATGNKHHGRTLLNTEHDCIGSRCRHHCSQFRLRSRKGGMLKAVMTVAVLVAGLAVASADWVNGYSRS